VSRVLVDVDGVLRDLIGGFCKHLNSIPGGMRRSPDDFTAYGFSQVLETEEILEFNRWAATGGYSTLRWYRGARELLFWLRGHTDVVALTAAYEDRDATQEFLRGYVDDRNVLFALPQHKHSHKGLALVEDRLETLKEWVETNPSGLGILVDRPWNRDECDHPRIVRGVGFRHIQQIIKTRLFLKESA
jgi:hypothetical protein